MKAVFRLLSGPRSAWVVLVLAVIAAGLGFALLPGQSSDAYPSAGLPADAQSEQVRRLLADFPDANTTAAVVVFESTSGPLTAQDKASIDQRATALAAESVAPQAVQPLYAQDGAAAMIAVPVETADSVDDQAAQLRKIANADLPSNVQAYLTGPVGFQADIANSFAGADTRLLIITVLVVAALLIITYRSPVLFLVPLIVVALGDGLARQLVTSIGSATDITIDPSISGIVSVLVFGAGTNYALLIIARYREELARHVDHHEAMARALRGSVPAILASGGTVTLSLLTLEFAVLGSNRTLGWSCAVGIVTAMAAALIVLPPALVVCGRRVFWPFTPRYGVEPKLGWWGKLGRRVASRPAPFIIAPVLGLAVLALGIGGISIGLAQTDQFVGTPESVQGQRIADRSFGAGATAQTIVLVPDAAVANATAVLKKSEGVVGIQPMGSANGRTELAVTLDADPSSDRAFDAIDTMRADLAAQPSTRDALVGGQDAQALDELRAAESDQRLIIPLILAVVFLVLVALLRALLAPILLIASVLATFAGALGAGTFLFTHVFGYPALDTSVLLFSFLFLVALGVDYNIFLTTRAREERRHQGTRDGMVRALGATGAVITSAGILLAAVFAVLGVLPVVALMQVGVIVCIGVLLDTLVVRTLLVPALAFALGERFWWPARPVTAGDESAPPVAGSLSAVGHESQP